MTMFSKAESARAFAYDLIVCTTGLTDVTIEEIESWHDGEVIEWIEAWGFTWNGVDEWEDLR